MQSGIYQVKNKLTNEIYIGQSQRIGRRWGHHKADARKRKKNGRLLEAIRLHGEESFEFSIIEFCEPTRLDEREIYWIRELTPHYNSEKGGSGIKPERLEKISASGTDQWRRKSEAEKLRISKLQLTGPQKGKARTDHTKMILSEKTKKHFEKLGGMPESQRKNISKALTGKSRPNAHQKKRVVGRKGEELFHFDSVKEAATHAQVHPSSISKCLKGKAKQAGGFEWEYRSLETIPEGSTAEEVTAGSAKRPKRPMI